MQKHYTTSDLHTIIGIGKSYYVKGGSEISLGRPSSTVEVQDVKVKFNAQKMIARKCNF